MRIFFRALLLTLSGVLPVLADESIDLAAARKAFEANLNAIRNRDREAYLASYLHADSLIRTGPTAFTLGFTDFAKQAGSQWPDTFDASDLNLTAVRPGIVYGTYRYRVRYGSDEHSGISERLFLSTPEGWKIALTSAFDAPPGTPAPPRAIAGATLIDGTGRKAVSDSVIITRDGKIDCAGTRAQCPVPAGVTTIDASGLWVTPGLIDAHVHFSQTGWADGRPDAVDVRERHPYEKVQADLQKRPELFARSYLCSGVTAVFDVGGFPWTETLGTRFEKDTTAPHVAAAGPLLSTRDHWVNLAGSRQFIHINEEKTARAAVRELAAHGAAAVKVWFIVSDDLPVARSAPVVLAVGDEARKAGLPLIVHATGLEEAKVSLRAGATLLVHSVWDVPLDDEFITLARQAGTIVTPTLTVVRGYVKLSQSIAARTVPSIDDPNGCVDLRTRRKIEGTAALPASPATESEALASRERRTRERESMAAANLRRLVGAGIPVAMGTDAGNPLTLHGPSVYAEMEAMQQAGMTAMQVLLASTSVGSRAMGRGKDLGTVEKGKAADLVVVGADPTSDILNMRRVRYVVRSGVVRSIEELSAVAREPISDE